MSIFSLFSHLLYIFALFCSPQFLLFSLCGWLLQACCCLLGLLHYFLSECCWVSFEEGRNPESLGSLPLSINQAWPPLILYIYTHSVYTQQSWDAPSQQEVKMNSNGRACWKKREKRGCAFAPTALRSFKANTQWKCVWHSVKCHFSQNWRHLLLFKDTIRISQLWNSAVENIISPEQKVFSLVTNKEIYEGGWLINLSAAMTVCLQKVADFRCVSNKFISSYLCTQTKCTHSPLPLKTTQPKCTYDFLDP